MANDGDLDPILERVRIVPGKKVDLRGYPSDWERPEKYSLQGMELSKNNAERLLESSMKDLTKMQEVLWADNRHSLLVILQGMDAAGKDGIIKHVMSGVNPQGCQVTSFRVPSAEELDHDFLWRCVKVIPEKGKIGIFNRSYYEEVLVVKVHTKFLENQRLPVEKWDQSFWKNRYRSINDLERHLALNGTVVIKFFLSVSKEEQKKRLLERIQTPEKRWKFNPGDIEERELWPQYMSAYEEMLEATSTEHAPWYSLPADQKWLTRVLAAVILASEIRSLGLRYPELPKEYLEAVEEAKAKLLKD